MRPRAVFKRGQKVASFALMATSGSPAAWPARPLLICVMLGIGHTASNPGLTIPNMVTRIGLRHPSPHKRRINAQRLPHSEPAGNPTDSNKPGTALVPKIPPIIVAIIIGWTVFLFCKFIGLGVYLGPLINSVSSPAIGVTALEYF